MVICPFSSPDDDVHSWVYNSSPEIWKVITDLDSSLTSLGHLYPDFQKAPVKSMATVYSWGWKYFKLEAQKSRQLESEAFKNPLPLVSELVVDASRS